jgi:hypothetical protein
MNPVSYYDRSKTSWGTEEAEELRKEYEVELLNIIQCADKHKRTPGCIAYKLKSMGIIVHNTLCRGYTEYKKSKLYEEVVLANEARKLEKKQEKKEEPTGEIKELKRETKKDRKENRKTLIQELNTIKSDVAELKNDVKEILKLINSIYEFETEK